MHNNIRKEDHDIMNLVKRFLDIEYKTDYSDYSEKVNNVIVTDEINKDSEALGDRLCSKAYWGGGGSAYIGTYIPGKITKAFEAALSNFLEKRKDYLNFKKILNIGYGRKSAKVTCPNCDSNISLKYGSRFKTCPICGSSKIISDSNHKKLETKKKLVNKAAGNLNSEVSKLGGFFVGGFSYHS